MRREESRDQPRYLAATAGRVAADVRRRVAVELEVFSFKFEAGHLDVAADVGIGIGIKGRLSSIPIPAPTPSAVRRSLTPPLGIPGLWHLATGNWQLANFKLES